MFIKPIQKKDKASGCVYTCYRLCESYRSGGKVRQKSLIYLGSLDEFQSEGQRKELADRIGQLYNNTPSLFPKDEIVEKLAHQFVVRLQRQESKVLLPGTDKKDKAPEFENIDLASIRHEYVRELGAEWLCQQATVQLKIGDMLKYKCGFDEQECKLALTQIVSRAVYPGSELKTQNRGGFRSVFLTNQPTG